MRADPLVFLVLLAFSPTGAAAQADSASIRAVLGAEDQRFAAMLRADTAALARDLAGDLTYTHTDGMHNSKAEFLRLVGSGALRYTTVTPQARTVRVAGPIAVVDGRSAMQVESDGHAHRFAIRYLAVYRRDARGWTLIAWQSTRLPDRSRPGPGRRAGGSSG